MTNRVPEAIDQNSGCDRWVLLTAAVTPQTDIKVAITSPAERHAQYRRAFEWWSDWCTRSETQLAIVETTGADPRGLLPRNSHCTWIPFDPPASLRDKGKGALEASAIDHALQVAPMEAKATVHKVTGRLAIANASTVLRGVDPGRVRLRRTLDRRYADTRVVTFNRADWPNFAGLAIEVADRSGVFLEHALAQRVIALEFTAGLEVEPFAARPQFKGSSGSTGTSYGSRARSAFAPLIDRLERRALRALRTKQF